MGRSSQPRTSQRKGSCSVASAIFSSSIGRSFLCKQQKSTTDHKGEGQPRNPSERKERTNREAGSSYHIHRRKPSEPPGPSPALHARATHQRPQRAPPPLVLSQLVATLPRSSRLSVETEAPRGHQVGGTETGSCSAALWALREKPRSHTAPRLVGHGQYQRPVSFRMFELRFECPDHTVPLTTTAFSHSKTWG